MLELAKSNETENKPKNVEEAIKAGWRTAKEMYECACVDRRTWDRFVDTIKKHAFQKLNSSCDRTFATEKCITGAHNTK